MSDFRLSALARADSRVRDLVLMTVMFVVGPLILAAVEKGKEFFPRYVQMMLFAFSWPLLVILGLMVRRLIRLNGLAKRGIQFSGVVERMVKARRSLVADVRYISQVGERIVRVSLPFSSPYLIYEGSRVTLLVDDPQRLDEAAIIGAA